MKQSLRLITHLCLFLLIALPVLSQENNFRIGIRYGYSLPFGQFASHELMRNGLEYGGYALIGKNFTAEGAWYFRPRLGVGLNFSAGTHTMATGYYVLDKKAADPALKDLWLKSGPYYIQSYMAGLFYRIPVTEKFRLELKAAGGILRAISPDQLYAGDFFVKGKLYWLKTSSTSIRASGMAGLNMNMKLFDHVELMISSEFCYARSVFRFWNANLTSYEDREMKMPVFKLQPGITITF